MALAGGTTPAWMLDPEYTPSFGFAGATQRITTLTPAFDDVPYDDLIGQVLDRVRQTRSEEVE